MAAAIQTVTDQPAVGDLDAGVSSDERPPCCSLYHHAVELIGKRWTGAILIVLMDGPLRFSEVGHLVPDVSDRLLSERLKELEGEEIVERHVYDDVPIRVEYALTEKGRALGPVLRALKDWSHEYRPSDCE